MSTKLSLPQLETVRLNPPAMPVAVLFGGPRLQDSGKEVRNEQGVIIFALAAAKFVLPNTMRNIQSPLNRSRRSIIVEIVWNRK